MIPLGSLTADQEFVNGTVTWAPFSGASGLGAAGPAARATEPLPTRASTTANNRLFNATWRYILDTLVLLLGNQERTRAGARLGLPPTATPVCSRVGGPAIETLVPCSCEDLVPRMVPARLLETRDLDLVHARLLLQHRRNRTETMRRMANLNRNALRDALAYVDRWIAFRRE